MARRSPRSVPGRASRWGCGPRPPRRRSASPRSGRSGWWRAASRSYSRSSRSRTMSMWRRPRNPQRKPKPSASEVSGSYESAASLRAGGRARRGGPRSCRCRSGKARRRPSAAPRGSRAAPRPRGAPAGRGVADPQPGDVLDPGDHVADLARRHPRRRPHLRGRRSRCRRCPPGWPASPLSAPLG